MNLENIPEEKIVQIVYKNYRNELSIRKIFPIEFYFNSTPQHTEPQYLLRAFDIEKKDYRSFAMKDILFWRAA